MYMFSLSSQTAVCTQVSTSSTGLGCTCATFRLVAGTSDQRCLHTMYAHAHLQDSSTSSTPDFAAPETVVPIRSSASSTAVPYAYWIDGSFVSKSPVAQQWKCSHDSHKSRCEHIDAVTTFLCNQASSDGLDDDERNFAQVLISSCWSHSRLLSNMSAAVWLTPPSACSG